MIDLKCFDYVLRKKISVQLLRYAHILNKYLIIRMLAIASTIRFETQTFNAEIKHFPLILSKVDKKSMMFL